VSSANLAVLRINNFYNNSKAKNELNMDFTPIDGAIGEAIRYFKGKWYFESNLLTTSHSLELLSLHNQFNPYELIVS